MTALAPTKKFGDVAEGEHLPEKSIELTPSVSK